MNSRQALLYALAALLLAGCKATAVPAEAALPATAATAVLAAQPSSAPTSITTTAASRTPAPTSTATASPTPALKVCSPLDDISLAELGSPDLLKNPFQAPRPGMDDGHHGADFAYWSRGDRKTMLGLPIHSVLNGKVAGVIQNMQPYGNAIIIETTLGSLPLDWLPKLPTPQPTVIPAANLYCPTSTVHYAENSGRSLYLLYAHMNQSTALSIGETVSCGDVIGQIGTTGKSVNPHLHLEMRLGPPGATFPSMGHYETAYTDEEMAAYCTWRVSGLFQMFDPMLLLQQQ